MNGNITENSISIKAFAKINLSIDVLGKRQDGMHEVDMVMQALDYYDTVTVTEEAPGAGPAILITCDRPEVPTDRSNICWKAAELMMDRRNARRDAYPDGQAPEERTTGVPAPKSVRIDIEKRIPVAAGMAGGSTDGAAVLHALNNLWDMGLTTSQLMELGGRLGADVPFCVLAQVGSTAARARGTGTEISPVAPFSGYVTFAKPPIGVSTKEVYKGIDACEILSRPDNDLLEQAAGTANRKAVTEQMINVLELYTLKAEPEVAELKALMEAELPEAGKILMSGSGPTVFALFGEEEGEKAAKARDLLRAAGYEAHCAALLK